MANSTKAPSTKSSNVSTKAASLKKSVRKSVTALARPFKKLKKSISTASIHSILSRSSNGTPDDSDKSDSGKSDSGKSDSGSTHSDKDPEVERSPEEELGM